MSADVLHITRRQRDLSFMARVLNRIDDPAARKAVIMSKRDRNQITDDETEQLIELCGVKST